MKGLWRWAFGYGPPHALAAFRIVFGTLSTLSLITLLIATFTEPALSWFGPADAMAYEPNPGMLLSRLTLLGPIGSMVAFRVVIGLGVVAGAALAFGWRTRVSATVHALVILTVAHRLPLAMMGADTVQRLCAIVLPFSSCGAVWSIDARGREPEDVPLWPQRLIQFQSALIYGSTLLIKAQGETWRDGTATWYPLRLQEFARFPLPDFLKSAAASRFTTYGTLLVEFALCALVWFRPWRTPVVLAGVGLHLFIDLAMNLPYFAFFMMAMYVLHFDGEEVRRRFAR